MWLLIGGYSRDNEITKWAHKFLNTHSHSNLNPEKS